MKKPKLVFSDAAVTDFLEQAEWYEGRSGARLAKRWERAVTTSLFKLLKTPHIGARCHFASDDLSNLRRIAIDGFPRHLIFYKAQGSEVLIIRIVHGARDLERLF